MVLRKRDQELLSEIYAATGIKASEFARRCVRFAAPKVLKGEISLMDFLAAAKE